MPILSTSFVCEKLGRFPQERTTISGRTDTKLFNFDSFLLVLTGESEMESNETGNNSIPEDPRFLAQSYLMYKIGK